jgi:purine-binding chemotaxis protein CheW
LSEKSTKGSRQYLTFTLAKETYALDIDKVREILDWTPVTRVPRCPDFMRGVINVRGGVVPVIDLRVKFGMEASTKTVDSCIVITEIALGDESIVLGALADSVQEVIDLEPEAIEPAPRIGTRLNTDFIHGMGKRDDEFIIILDIDRIFSEEELALAQSESEDSLASNS